MDVHSRLIRAGAHPRFDPERVLFPLVGAIGGVLTVWAVALLFLGFHSATWPTTHARVIHADVEVSEYRDPGRVDVGTVRAGIHYSYSVDGREYVGDRISYGYFYSSVAGDEVREYIERYPVGKTVTVSYDPARPDWAVLEPGVEGSMLVLLGIGLVLAFIGLALPACMPAAGPLCSAKRDPRSP